MIRRACVTVIPAVVFFVWGSVLAQDPQAPEQIKKWKPVIGHWKNQEELRESPSGSWTKESSEWEIRWAPGGYCVEILGKLPIGGSFVELTGYDPQMKTLTGLGFANNQVRWNITSAGWDGTTLTDNWTDTMPDGTNRIGTCAWAYASDFKSMQGTCKLFTDGKWWVFRKVKAVRVK